MKSKDVFSPDKRREIMSKIRSKGTKPEILIKALLDKAGVRYVYQAKVDLGGRSRVVDFLIPDKKVVIEYRSCFWHGCPLHYRGVKGGILGREWWEEKIRRNRERDRELEKSLREKGYRLVVVWGHDLKKVGEMIGAVVGGGKDT